MAKKEPTIQIVWQRVSITEGFSSVLFPLDVFDLLRQLPNIGYVVPDLVLRGTPEANRPIATKGDVELTISQDNKTIGVRGRGPEKIVEAFKELREFYLENLDPSPSLATRYLEFDGHGWVKSKSNPSEVFNRLWKDHKVFHDLSSLLGENVSNFGLELTPPNKDPNDPNWFHINIQPVVVSSNKRYRVRWIWRGENLKELLNKFSKIDETLLKVISKLEG